MATINQEDKNQAEALIRAFINENFPEIETRKGSAFRSLVISPAAAFYALLLAEQEQFRNSLSLANISIEDFDESIIEAFISNYLVTRNTGSKTTGILRLDGSTSKTYTISEEVRFITGDEIEFKPTADGTFSPDPTEDQGTLFEDPDTGTFFFLVNVESVEVSNVQIEQDTVFTLTSDSFVDNDLVGIAAYNEFATGTSAETLEEYRARAVESVTVRNLVTDKSIRAVIPENFAQVSRIQPVGYGEVEMIRDLVLPHNIHKGGDIDIFVRTGELPATQVYEKAVVSNLQVELLPPETPIYKIEKIELQDGNSLTLLTEGTDYEVDFDSTALVEQSFVTNVTVEYYSRFSTSEKVVIRFLNPTYANRRAVITVSAPTSIQTIQDFVDDENNRVIAASLWVRAFAPVFISMDISYRVTGTDEPVDEDALKLEIQSYVNALAGLDTIEVSKIVQIMEQATGLKSVVLPVTVVAEVNKTNGSVETVTTQDKLVIETDRTIGFSQRICQYILKPEDITLTKVIDG
jgi:hypothetical protein